jgi:hypothetical protein
MERHRKRHPPPPQTPLLSAHPGKYPGKEQRSTQHAAPVITPQVTTDRQVHLAVIYSTTPRVSYKQEQLGPIPYLGIGFSGR